MKHTMIVVLVISTVLVSAGAALAQAPDATFVADVTVPDDSVFPAGSLFSKTWRFRNTGDSDWLPDYALVFAAGDTLGAPITHRLATTLPPGHAIDLSLAMVAPVQPGTYKSWWQMQDDNGVRFGDRVYVRIVVEAHAAPVPQYPTAEARGKPVIEGTLAMSEARRLAALAESRLDVNSEQALLLALASTGLYETAEGLSALAAAVGAHPYRLDLAGSPTTARLPINDLIFSPDGQTLALVDGSGALLWPTDFRTPADVLVAQGLAQEMQRHISPRHTVAAFSLDGSTFALAGDSVIRLWDVASRTLTGTLAGHSGPFNALAFSPDGERIASASDDGTVVVQRLAGDDLPAVLRTDRAAALSVVFENDDVVIVGNEKGTLVAWDLATGHSEPLPTPMTGRVAHLFRVRTGGILAIDQRTVVVYRRNKDGQYLPGVTVWAHPRDIVDADNRGDGGALAVLDRNGNLSVLQLRWPPAEFSGQLLATIPQAAPSFSPLAISPDGRLLATVWCDKTEVPFCAGNVRVWDVTAGFTARSLDGGWGIALSPDGTRVALGQANRVSIRNVQGDDLLELEAPPSLPGQVNMFTALSFDPAGALLAAGGPYGRAIDLWDVQSGELLAALAGPRPVSDLAFTPDGHVLVTAHFDRIALWDVSAPVAVAAALAPLHTLTTSSDGARSISVSPDGALLAAAGHDRSVRLWDLPLALHAQLPGTVLWESEQELDALRFSCDGTLLAWGAADGNVTLWDVSSNLELGTVTGHSGIASLAFSSDDRWLASGNNDGTIEIWDTETLQLRQRLSRHPGAADSLAFSPVPVELPALLPGESVVLLARAGMAGHVLRAGLDIVDPAMLRMLGCARASRQFTAAEVAEFDVPEAAEALCAWRERQPRALVTPLVTEQFPRTEPVSTPAAPYPTESPLTAPPEELPAEPTAAPTGSATHTPVPDATDAPPVTGRPEVTAYLEALLPIRDDVWRWVGGEPTRHHEDASALGKAIHELGQTWTEISPLVLQDGLPQSTVELIADFHHRWPAAYLHYYPNDAHEFAQAWDRLIERSYDEKSIAAADAVIRLAILLRQLPALESQGWARLCDHYGFPLPARPRSGEKPAVVPTAQKHIAEEEVTRQSPTEQP